MIRRLVPALLLLTTPAFASLDSISINSDEKFPAPRWMYGEKDNRKLDPTSAALMEIKRAQIEKDYDGCLKKIATVRDRARSLGPWIAVVELECAANAKPSVSGSARLAQVLARVNQNPTWILRGPQAQMLRAQMIEASLTAIDQDLKLNRARAWKTIETVQDFLVHMDKAQRARLWRSAGELAFIEQKTDAARDYFRRSLLEINAPDLRARLLALQPIATKSVLPPQVAANETSNETDADVELAPAAPVAEAKPTAAPDTSNDESQLVDRVTAAMKAGELAAAVEDAVKLVVNYPGSTRAKWASDRILEAYAPLIDKTDSKYTLLRERIMKLMQKADPDRLAEWSRWLFGRGQYSDSFTIVVRALNDLRGAKRTALLDLASKAALASDKFEDARDYSLELVEKHSGTKEAREAIFRIGLLAFRAGKFPEAAAQLEKVTLLPPSESIDLSARYWLWRSLQKSKSERAASVAADLAKRYPFSYYGLRARLESGATFEEWKSPVKRVASKIWLTSGERLGWERAQLLIKAGWLDEAQAELRLLPPPMQAEDKAVRALLWASAGQYLTSQKLIGDAWDQKSELRGPPFLAAAFPPEFNTWITEEAKTRNIDRYLVKSLIKQESGFNPRAVSGANALGLMQLVPPTAKEVAVDLKSGAVEFPNDMYQPKRNIQFGTYYLSRMIARFQGNVPLALASYNAGQGRIDRWLRSRPSLKNLASQKTSAADTELWIDEIPYAETSFYVKAILRNLLIYRFLDAADGRVEMTDPIWLTSVSPPDSVQKSH